MSEAFEKVAGLTRLPLFPLHLVLLPGEMLPLHIFEPRYQQMLKDIEVDRKIFGLSYFDSANTLVDRPESGTIGCAAEVHQIERLDDGRANVITVGLIRYRLVDYLDAGDPYLVGEVEFFEDDPEDDETLQPLADEVFELFKRVARAAHRLSGEKGEFPDLPQAEPQQLSFLVTAAFDVSNDIKYSLLQFRSTSERLKRLREILWKTVGRMEESADIHKLSQTNGHSKKKIDL